MAISKRLHIGFYFLLFYGVIAHQDAKSSEIHEPELQYTHAVRSLQASTGKLKINLTNSKYIDQNLVVTLQDRCTLSTKLVCMRDPAYPQSQIPEPFKIPRISSIPSLIYEYTGNYTNPITIDIYYHTPGTFTKEDYRGNKQTGSVDVTTIPELKFRRNDQDELKILTSLYLHGYLKGPKSDKLEVSFLHNDEGILWVNYFNIYYSYYVGTATFNYTFVEDLLYYVDIYIDNNKPSFIDIELKWKLSSSFEFVNEVYMTEPKRIPGIPYHLSSLKYNTYCDDVNDFRCVVCDGLCLTCAESTSSKVCTSCKPNSQLLDGQCNCVPKYYLQASEPDSCNPCTGLCEECEEIGGVYKCKTCKSNATFNQETRTCTCNPNFYLEDIYPSNCKLNTILCTEINNLASRCIECIPNAIIDQDSGLCKCNSTFYSLSSNPSICTPCTGLCNECEDLDGAYKCKSCKNNATLDLASGTCNCNATFYLSASDPNNCKPCTDLCEECEEVAGIYRCKSCKPNAIYDAESGTCSCNPTFYLSAPDPDNCRPCTELCEECEEVNGVYRCKSCKPNSNLDTVSGTCTCNPTFYLSATDHSVCTQCNPLCSSCEEKLGSQVCLSCKEFARLEVDDCFCVEGYYLPYFDPNPLQCHECPSNCATCEDYLNNIVCTSCKENSVLIGESCECKEGYYLYDVVNFDCRLCEGLCTLCNRFECTSCAENAEIKDWTCHCKEGYYQSAKDSKQCNLSIPEDPPSNDYTQQSEDSSKTADDDIDWIKYVIISTVSVVTLVNLLNKNYNSIWMILSTLQIISFSPFLNIDLPNRVITLAQGMSLNIMPNIFEFFLQSQSDLIPDRYKEMEYNTSIYLLNIGDILTILLINTAFYILLKLTHLIFKTREGKFMSILSKVILGYEWSFYLRFMTQGYLDIAVSSSFTLKYLPKDLEILDYTFAAISMTIVSLFPIFVYKFLRRNFESLSTEDNLSKWGSLYYDIDYKKSKGASYNLLVYLSRRLAYSISINFLDFNPLVQLGVCYVSSLYVIYIQCLIYLLYFKPYDNKTDQITQTAVESMILVYFIILNGFIQDISNEAHEALEWVCVGIMVGSISILALVNTSRSLYQLIQKCKRRLESRQVYDEVEGDKRNTEQVSNLEITQTQVNTSFEINTSSIPSFYDSLSLRENRMPKNKHSGL